MKFLYKAKKSLNEITEGTIEKESVEQVIEELQAKGLVPVSIQPQGPTVSGGAPSLKTVTKNNLRFKSGKWGLKQLALFTQKLYNLINTRVELLNALRLLEKNCANQTEKTLLTEIIKNIKDGMSFSETLSRYPKYFPELYIHIIHTGESTGKLKDALIQLLDYLRRLEDLRLKVKQALAYPIFMTIVGIGTIGVMLTFVLPRLAGMFDDFQAQLPMPTLILLNTANFIKQYWFLLIIFFSLLISALRFRFQGKESLFGRLKYQLPIAKGIIYKQSIANFSRSISLLLKSGVTLMAALSDAALVIGNPIYIQQLEEVRKDIAGGVTFSDALSKFKIFPDFFVQMIRVGEEGGRLDQVLTDIAESYDKEIEADLKTISSLIEPAIILILGLVIGGMVVAMLLPVFNMSTLFGS